MDSLITAAARALAAGDPLAALKRVGLRDDPAALALRGIAMAQLGDLARAKALLRSAAQGFGPHEATARARCLVAEAEIALVSRDLGGPTRRLGAARATLAARGDRANAAHAGYLEARRLLLIGRLDDAERTLASCDLDALPPASRTGYWLVAAGIAVRRVSAAPARAALERAGAAARATGISALVAEADRASQALEAPAARLLGLGEVEALIASGALIIDACRGVVRAGENVVPLAGRPVLFALARALAEALPENVSRETLLARAFRARQADESHRARLRVEIGRLRKALAPLPAPGNGMDSGLAWADGSLWVGQYRDRRIHQIDPETGAVLRTIDSDRFVTGVTWVDGELWHGTWEGEASDVRRIDPATGEVLERLEMPAGTGVSGLESDGDDRFFCGAGSGSGSVRVIRRPRR
jgi:hypothetical protein